MIVRYMGVDVKCPRCESDSYAEITTLDSMIADFICRDCGCHYSRIPVMNAPCIGAIQGCAVPTPEDILRSAGLLYEPIHTSTCTGRTGISYNPGGYIKRIAVPYGPGLGYTGNATS